MGGTRHLEAEDTGYGRTRKGAKQGMAKDTLTVTDNRTGQTYELPINDGTIRAMDLRGIKVNDDDFGVMSYDPAFGNTASCKSKITFIDGEKGILRYRGYPIEQLAERSTYLECAYLLINGELPTRSEIELFTHNITYHTMVHENVRKFIQGFRYDAHPMGILLSSVAALSTYYPEAKAIDDPEARRTQVHRLIAKMPTLAAWAYRNRRGLPMTQPDRRMAASSSKIRDATLPVLRVLPSITARISRV